MLSRSIMSDSLRLHGVCSPPGSSVHGGALGKNTGVGCHTFFPGALPNPGIESRSPAFQADPLPSEPPGKTPRILEWVAYPFSRGPSGLRNWTGVSYIAGEFFTSWVRRKPQYYHYPWAFQVAPVVKNLPATAGDVRDLGSILASGRSPGIGNGISLQYSCFENPMDRGSLWAWLSEHNNIIFHVF